MIVRASIKKSETFCLNFLACYTLCNERLIFLDNQGLLCQLMIK